MRCKISLPFWFLNSLGLSSTLHLPLHSLSSANSPLAHHAFCDTSMPLFLMLKMLTFSFPWPVGQFFIHSLEFNWDVTSSLKPSEHTQLNLHSALFQNHMHTNHGCVISLIKLEYDYILYFEFIKDKDNLIYIQYFHHLTVCMAHSWSSKITELKFIL